MFQPCRSCLIGTLLKPELKLPRNACPSSSSSSSTGERTLRTSQCLGHFYSLSLSFFLNASATYLAGKADPPSKKKELQARGRKEDKKKGVRSLFQASSEGEREKGADLFCKVFFICMYYDSLPFFAWLEEEACLHSCKWARFVSQLRRRKRGRLFCDRPLRREREQIAKL